jgi:hypothetical protein
MTEQRDPLLQTLFAEAEQPLAGEALTARVLARTRNFRYVLLAGLTAAAAAILAGTWLFFGIPLFEFAVLIAAVLTTPLFELGEGWLALALLPINTVASALLVLLKGARMLQKKIVAASFGK